MKRHMDFCAKKALDLRLYLVTDAAERCRFGLLETVERAIAGGATVVQYRSTNPDAQTRRKEAAALAELTRSRGTTFIVNDSVELALEVGADGVHVGQRDVPAAEARRRIGPEKILGLSVSDRAELDAADAAIVDYLGIGPVFPTISKADAAPALGFENFVKLAALSPLPVVAIGGINAARARELRASGTIAGVAVISAICGANDPKAAARALLA